MSASSLQILGALVLGLLMGQLTTGIPLSRRLSKAERRRRPKLPDWGEVLLDEWPDDQARRQLDAWHAAPRWEPASPSWPYS